MTGKLSLKEAFNAAAYRAAFPEKLANLFVTLGTERIFIAPEIADFIAKNPSLTEKKIEERLDWMKARGSCAAAARDYIGFVPVNHIAMKDLKPGAQERDIRRQIQDAEHEAGHFIVENGLGASPHLGECAADAFATLRHIQRFGGMTEDAAAELAHHAVFETPPPIHYTSAVVQKIRNMHDGGKIDIRGLSLEKTAALAAKIAAAYALDDATLGKISDAFAPVNWIVATDKRPLSDSGKLRDIFKTIAEVMLDNRHDEDIYRAGRLCFECKKTKDMIAAKLPHDAVLYNLRRKMAQHEEETGFILDPALAVDKKRAAGKAPPAPKPERNAP